MPILIAKDVSNEEFKRLRSASATIHKNEVGLSESSKNEIASANFSSFISELHQPLSRQLAAAQETESTQKQVFMGDVSPALRSIKKLPSLTRTISSGWSSHPPPSLTLNRALSEQNKADNESSTDRQHREVAHIIPAVIEPKLT